jgi:lysophospholipase L1-like esterase
VISKTQQLFPGIRILLLGILPNSRSEEKMRAANVFVKAHADGKKVIFVDAGAAFVREVDNWRGLSEDRLHPNELGYRQLGAAIDQELAKILGYAPRNPLP